MNGGTCAACDSEFDAEIIVVTLEGERVEVCCEACALALGEAQAATLAEGER